MTELEYRSHPAISRSELWKIRESPEKFKWYKDHPEPPTPSLLFGQAAHKLLLEPDTFNDEFAVAPKVNLRTNAGKEKMDAFREENAGKTILPEEDYNKAALMALKCRSDPDTFRLLHGKHELPIFWTDEPTGEKCKCRLDVLNELDGEPVIVDYKTTSDARTDSFMRSVFKYGYHFQSGMYGAGVQSALKLESLPRFILIAQETKPPYAINRVELQTDVIQHGYDLFRQYIGIYHECKELGLWYGYNGPLGLMNEVELPDWVRMEDSE